MLQGWFVGRRSRKNAAVLERTALGETAVSFTALSQIAEHTVKRHAEVNACKARVRAIGSSIFINVRAVTAPEVNLLTMTHALEDEINASVEAACGVRIGLVDVAIDQADDKRNRA